MWNDEFTKTWVLVTKLCIYLEQLKRVTRLGMGCKAHPFAASLKSMMFNTVPGGGQVQSS